jgi:hypothetical protein
MRNTRAITEILFDYSELFPLRKAHPASFRPIERPAAKGVSPAAFFGPDTSDSAALQASARRAMGISRNCDPDGI